MTRGAATTVDAHKSDAAALLLDLATCRIHYWVCEHACVHAFPLTFASSLQSGSTSHPRFVSAISEGKYLHATVAHADIAQTASRTAAASYPHSLALSLYSRLIP
jgi:hypothetical protein